MFKRITNSLIGDRGSKEQRSSDTHNSHTANSSQHCPSCTCQSLPPDTHPDIEDLLYDTRGDPWGPYTLPLTLQRLAEELTRGSYEIRETAFDYGRAGRRFTYIASLVPRNSGHDFGIPYKRDYHIRDRECKLAGTLAFEMTDMGKWTDVDKCPSRSEVINYTDGKGGPHKLLNEHLRDIEASCVQAGKPSRIHLTKIDDWTTEGGLAEHSTGKTTEDGSVGQ